MPLTFNKAPLAELIAELKWPLMTTMPAPEPHGNAIQLPMFNTASSEEFFGRFGAIVQERGFTSVERMIPAGYPIAPFQVVYRYKNAQRKEVLQAGPGIFSANALRPYQSWHNFRPNVVTGIEAALAARPASEKGSPIAVVSLRYINSFTPELTGGITAAQFVRDVLGIQTTLPQSISNHLSEGADPNPNLTFSFPLKNGLQMQIIVGYGFVESTQTIILDLLTQSIAPIAPDVREIMNTLDSARKVMHDMFIGLTLPISRGLEPEGTDDG